MRRVLAGAAALGILFFLAIRYAPEEERAFRATPEARQLFHSGLATQPAEAEIRALIYMEGRAALRGDEEAAVRLFSADGQIRDANYTPADSTDDRIWAGLDAIRERYRAEFAARRYLALAHTDASVVVEGDRATVVNDLRAEIRTREGIQRVYLSRGDRWTFRRERDRWRIVGLTVNRAPR